MSLTIQSVEKADSGVRDDDEMDKELVRQIVRETIEEMKRQGLLTSVSELAYSEATSLLSDYYKDGMADELVSAAINDLSGDKYKEIIPLYFGYGYTIERIAEIYDVDVSTITRNKRRLCLSIYNSIQEGKT